MMKPHPSRSIEDDTRGITWTIEAFLSVIVLLGVLYFTLTSFPAPDPGAQQIEAHGLQLQQTGQDILGGLESNGDLNKGLLYVDPSSTSSGSPVWHDPSGDKLTSAGDYYTLPTDHPYSPAFNFLTRNNVFYNIDVVYQDTVQTTASPVSLVYQGVPNKNAVVIEYTTVIQEDDVLLNSDGTEVTGSQCTGIAGDDPVTLADAEGSPSCNFYMDRIFNEDATSRYNVARVRLTLWT